MTVADTERQRPSFVAGLVRTLPVLGFTAAVAGGAALCWVLVGSDIRSIHAPLQVPWPVLAAGFTLGHFAAIRIEIRKNAQKIDLTDVVLLPAMVFARPGLVVLAAALGTAVHSLLTRAPIVKSAFNVFLHALSAVIAIACFHAVLGTASVLSARGWVAGIVALLAAMVTTEVAIQVVIALDARRLSISGLDMGLTLLLMLVVDTALGFAAVNLLWTSLGGGILFVAVAAAVAVGYVSLGRLRVRHTTLEHLYHFEQMVAGMVESDTVIATVLSEALTLFNAEVAQLVLPGPDADECHTLRMGQSRPVMTQGPHPLADLLGPGTEMILAPRGVQDPAIAEALDESGFRDAIAVRLPAEVAGKLEVLVIANRLGGEHVTFSASDTTVAVTLATPTSMALRSSDLLEQLRAQVAIKEYQASHDVLTGLANRRLFCAELDRALAERSTDALVGVVLIDLDGFKSLNDTAGHEAGDSFLQTLAISFSGVVGDKGMVGRLGGDEFAVVIPDARGLLEIAAIAEELSVSVRDAVTVTETSVDLWASIGVTAGPLHGNDRFTLLRQADLAMYWAKQHGGGVALHDDYQDGQIDRPTLISALREALSSSSLRLHYQPKVDFATGVVTGVEALARWTHSRFGKMAPEQFIAVAESSGLIRPLTRWLFTTALAQCSSWRDDGIDLNVAVNLSPLQINDTAVVEHVRQLLDFHNLPPECLTIEITESPTLTDQSGGGHHVLGSLASMGVRISLDDFGVGSSSLARVKHLPISELKIDKFFITNLTHDVADDAIVESTINLAHRLGLVVVAEGVETDTSYWQLRNLGCDIAQGYFVSTPMPPESLVSWIRGRNQEVKYPTNALRVRGDVPTPASVRPSFASSDRVAFTSS